MDDLKQKTKESKALLVYFFNDSCAPCLALRPKVKELLEKDFPGMDMIMVNAVENPGLPASMGVFSSPTVLLFFDGKETVRKSKFVSIPELKKAIDRYYQLLFN